MTEIVSGVTDLWSRGIAKSLLNNAQQPCKLPQMAYRCVTKGSQRELSQKIDPSFRFNKS